ncbi:ankyrin repeat domain-containing protein [Candidatus Neptunochlamydia vexilliferae]|nr:ankyrin repeat domain-containing protein [Candidatus Neptunochlamydia vexilliferae]
MTFFSANKGPVEKAHSSTFHSPSGKTRRFANLLYLGICQFANFRIFLESHREIWRKRLSQQVPKYFFFLALMAQALLFGGPESEFFRACLSGDLVGVVSLYEKEGMRLVYARDKDGNTPLHLACCSKKGGHKKEIITFLLSKGVNVNAPNNYQSTPLIIAVSNGNYEATELLLKQKEIKVNQPTQEGFTPLHIAVTNRAPPLIKLLLNHPGVNPNFGTRDGATPLHFAAMQGLEEEAKLLINCPSTDINAPQHGQNYGGATPLHFAAMQAETEIVRALVETGRAHVQAMLTAGVYNGFTPLHFVVLNPDSVNVFETAKLLIQHGANPKTKCAAEKTPLELTSVSIIQALLKNPKKARE